MQGKTPSGRDAVPRDPAQQHGRGALLRDPAYHFSKLFLMAHARSHASRRDMEFGDRTLVWITVRMGGVPPPGAPDDRFDILELRLPTELFFCFFRRSY